VHYSPEPFFVIDTAFYLEATKQVDRRWAYYCLLTYDINGMDSGSAIPSTSREAFYRLPVRVPPLQEQRAIAHILGTLDDKIELNQRMNETLEAMARAIFQSWFVDFDPVRSKAAGRQPPGLAPHIAGLFPDAFEESELGEIPRGWHAEEIGELCDIALGGDWGDDQPSEKKAVEAVCLRGVDLEHLRHSGWADAPHRWLKRTSVAARRLDERDVLVAASGVGPIGRPLWVAHQLEAAYDLAVIYSNFCKRLRCKSVAMAVYVDRWLQLMRESGEIWEYANGTSIPNLDAKSLLSSKAIVVPPESILEFLLSIVRPVTERLYSLESRTLITLREVLLPKLISGELRVEDAESIVRRCT
jgi:type I restriction enzyme S subunit